MATGGAKTSAVDFKSFSAAREVFAHRFFHRLRWASLAQHVLFARHRVELEWAFRSSQWTNQPGLAMRGMFDGRLERPAARSLEYDRIATIPSDFAATCRSEGCFSSAPSCRSHEGLRSAFTCPPPAWSSSKEK